MKNINQTELRIDGDAFAAEQGYANLQEMRDALDRMSKMSFAEIDPAELADLTEIELDDSQSVEERVLSLLRHTRNPYFFRYNGAVIKMSFAEKQTLEECITNCMYSA